MPRLRRVNSHRVIGSCYLAAMIDVRAHSRDPIALVELIARTFHDGVVIDREPAVGNLALLVAEEEREGARRRAQWAWLNSVMSATPRDPDNDWSDV
jgi:hypothetical protein